MSSTSVLVGKILTLLNLDDVLIKDKDSIYLTISVAGDAISSGKYALYGALLKNMQQMLIPSKETEITMQAIELIESFLEMLDEAISGDSDDWSASQDDTEELNVEDDYEDEESEDGEPEDEDDEDDEDTDEDEDSEDGEPEDEPKMSNIKIPKLGKQIPYDSKAEEYYSKPVSDKIVEKATAPVKKETKKEVTQTFQDFSHLGKAVRVRVAPAHKDE